MPQAAALLASGQASGQDNPGERIRPYQVKPGEVRNPWGRNGAESRVTVRRFMEEMDGDRKRVRAVLESMYTAASSGNDAAAKLLIEHGYGRPGMGAAETRLALAEHIRKVARDRAELALGVLGARVHTMTDDEKVAFFNRCASDAREFLAAAEAELEAHETRGVVASPAVEQAPALAEPAKEAAPSDAAPDGEEDDE